MRTGRPSSGCARASASTRRDGAPSSGCASPTSCGGVASRLSGGRRGRTRPRSSPESVIRIWRNDCGSPRGILMKVSFLTRAGFEDEATKVLRSAIDLHPEAPELARSLGLALVRSGHYEAAADAVHAATQHDSKDASAAAVRGAALLLAGRT